MPFLRFSRDKRGYEHTYLVDTFARRGKPSRTRILYWYRTPPGVRVGRLAFDPDVRRALEAKYPHITFDWKALESTPVPPPEPEYWRERRRAERAAKQARRQEELADALTEGEDQFRDQEPPDEPAAVDLSIAILAEEGEAASEEAASVDPAVPGPAGGAVVSAESPARRRRRRGGRRRRGRGNGAAPAAANGAEPSNVPETPDEDQPDNGDSTSEDQ